MTDLSALDNFVESLVPDQSQKKKISVEQQTELGEDVKLKSRKGAVKSLLGQVEIEFEEFDQDRAIPTMIHLSPSTRKKLMALVADLQIKHQRRFTLSKVGSKLIEKALS